MFASSLCCCVVQERQKKMSLLACLVTVLLHRVSETREFWKQSTVCPLVVVRLLPVYQIIMVLKTLLGPSRKHLKSHASDLRQTL